MNPPVIGKNLTPVLYPADRFKHCAANSRGYAAQRDINPLQI